ncbi:MAG: hypothetical protein WA816_01845 [Bacteroidales bacterium]
MIPGKKRIINLIFIFSIFFFLFINTLSAQDNNSDGLNLPLKILSQKQDTNSNGWKKQSEVTTEPDTNFTWEKYASFLNKISDTSKYIVLPLNEFRKTFNSRKVIIGLRHDIDNDLNVAYKFSEVEYNLGFRSTYFILHTAPYYLLNSNNMAVHTEKIIPILKTMQNVRHFEIGWHNDLVTLQVVYNINPVTFLRNELNWLRSNGINIVGTASHGSTYCKTYHYLNYYFFEECTFPVVPNFGNNVTVPVGNKNIDLIKGKLSDFGLQYEAYFLNNNKKFSDATITNSIRWNIGMLDLNQLQAGDRVIILLHPMHWHKASRNADFESFSLTGQKSCSVDTIKSVISVTMPYGTNKGSLLAAYTLSPGAYVKVAGKAQVNNGTLNDFSNPLVYKVYAENRSIYKEWTINVHNAENSACDFLSFIIQGFTKSVNIDPANKSILVQVNESADLNHLHLQFDISPGASAWLGKNKVLKNSDIVDFSKKVEIRVLAEDGISSKIWEVKIKK